MREPHKLVSVDFGQHLADYLVALCGGSCSPPSASATSEAKACTEACPRRAHGAGASALASGSASDRRPRDVLRIFGYDMHYMHRLLAADAVDTAAPRSGLLLRTHSASDSA